MKEPETYENFPFWMPVLSILLSLAIYGMGAVILTGYGSGLAVFYLLFCAGVEVRVMKKSCVNCYYYGKGCGIGKGRLCALLFRKGDPKKFSETKIAWTDLLPDVLVPIFPLIGGTVLLVRDFSASLAAMVLLILALGTVGNGMVRSGYACRFCKQRVCGCPAERLFSKG